MATAVRQDCSVVLVEVAELLAVAGRKRAGAPPTTRAPELVVLVGPRQ
jgi:hypothetical protein